MQSCEALFCEHTKRQLYIRASFQFLVLAISDSGLCKFVKQTGQTFMTWHHGVTMFNLPSIISSQIRRVIKPEATRWIQLLQPLPTSAVKMALTHSVSLSYSAHLSSCRVQCWSKAGAQAGGARRSRGRLALQAGDPLAGTLQPRLPVLRGRRDVTYHPTGVLQQGGHMHLVSFVPFQQ